MADVKIAYAADTELTITLASLASDTNLLAGRESAAVSNTSNLFVDYLLSGKVTTGTSPTDVRQIEVWVYSALDDTPTYQDVFDGTDSNETITSVGIKNSILRLAALIATNNTSDRTYGWGQVSLASLYGGIIPPNWGIFIVHNTGVALNATAGNHSVWYKPVYYTVV